MRLSTAADGFIDDARLRGLAASTLIRYRSDLRLLVAMATVEAADSVIAFTPALVRAYFGAMSKKGLTMATLHRRRAALNEFAKWGLKRRLWAEDPMADMPRIKKPPRLPRPFSPEERQAVMSLTLPKREHVVRALLYYTGLRVTPICEIRLVDVSFQAIELGEGLVWPGAIRTRGKGNVEHVVPMHPELKEILFDWVTSRSDLLNLKSFLLERRNGKPVTRKVVARMTNGWGKAAKVEKCTPHRFRHTTATVLLESGVDIRVIQAWLGHADLSTTEVYTKVVNRELAKALAKFPTAQSGSPGGPVTEGVTGPSSVPHAEMDDPASRKSAE